MEQKQNLINALGTAFAQGQPVNVDPQEKVLDFKFSIREATLILNKLNTASFTGFGEASQAMQIFGKIQATVKENQLAEESKNKAIRPDASFTAPPQVKTPATPAAPTEETPVEEVNTAAPMAAVSEIKQTAQPVSEEADTGQTAKPAVAADDSVPPEDAGVFSVINKSGDI
jgi:hypothetical protein